MALTDNRTQLQDCDATGDVSGDSDASPQSRTTEAGLVIEGPSSIQFQVTNAQEHILFDLDSAGATFNLDLSDSTVYIAIKDNLADTFANLGGLICLNDGADGAGGDDIGYAVAGVDVGGLPYAKKFAFYKLDVSVVVAAPGTDNVDFYTYNGVEANLDQTSILQIGYGSIHLAKGQGTIPNAWFDGIYYIANDSYAATVSGGSTGTPETMADLVGDDETVGAGLFSNPIGAAYYIFGPTEWGDAGTGNSGFEGTDEQWYYLGDNGGGHAVGASHFPMRLVGNATGTNAFRQTRVTNINTGTRAQFDFSNSDFDELELDATNWVDFGVLTFPAQDASKFANASTFINCDQMYLSSCDMDGNTFNGTTDVTGAILWDENSNEENQDNLVFVSDGTGAAINVAPTGAGPFVFNITGYEFDGYAGQSGTAANRVFYIDPANNDADTITINLTNCIASNIVGGGSGFSYVLAAGVTGTPTINNTVTLQVTAVDEDNVAIPYASVTIANAATRAIISDGVANNLGVYTDSTYNYGGDVGVVVIVRKSSPGDARYLPVESPSTIISTGLTTTVGLALDSRAGIIPMTGVLRHGVQSENVNDDTITITVDVPAGVNRKLYVAGMYWNTGGPNLSVVDATYDTDAMSFINSRAGGSVNEIFGYWYVIPNNDIGPKEISFIFSAAVSIKAIAFVIIDDVQNAVEDSATSFADAQTSNPTFSLENDITADAYSIGFLITDDLDSPTATGASENRVRRSDLARDALANSIAILIADRDTSAVHSIGADYGANSKSWVGVSAIFGKN